MLEQAPKDSLTGFYLRQALEPFLHKLITDFPVTHKPFAVALIDIDHFKHYNDTLGHLFGDEVLKYSTSTFRLSFQDASCVLFRYGGDEFVAVFPEKTAKEAYAFLRRCQRHLKYRPCLCQNRFFHVTVSSGIAGFPDDTQGVSELLKKADEAMYFSKKTGRNRVSIYAQLSLLRMKRIAAFWGFVLLLVAVLTAAYHFTYQSIIRPTFGQIRHMKIVTKPEHLDTILLQNGLTFEGRILSESSGSVLMKIYFDNGGEGQTTFRRNEISQIKYGKTASAARAGLR